MKNKYNDFFVMLYTQNGGFIHMIDEDDDLATFETEDDAVKEAKKTILGSEFGFEVFEIGSGIGY